MRNVPEPAEHIASRILVIRGYKVMLDTDLAKLHGVPTKRLNEQVKRNAARFAEDFMFRLTPEESDALDRSHFATGSGKHRDPRFAPYAFTTVELPRAVEVPAIRKELRLSQEQFASLMGVSVGTLRNWEQGRREPHGPARSLLLVASREPASVLKALAAAGYPAKPVGVAQRTKRYRVSKRGSRSGVR